MIDSRFPTYTPGSRRLYEFELAGETHLLAQELERSAAAWSAAGDAKIAKGAMTADEARRGRTLWEAVRTDVALSIVASRQAALGNKPDTAAELARHRQQYGVAWADKVEALRREIEARRAAYPGQVEKGQLTRDQARAQLERLEAVHDLYWHHGFAFDGTRAELRALTVPILDYDVEQQGAAVVGNSRIAGATA